MDDFDSLDSLYEHLERNAASYKYQHNIGTLFQKLRDFFHKNNDTNKAKIAQWEVDFFNFRLEQGAALTMFEMTDEKGNPVTYPNFQNFDEDKYQYLVERLENTSNPLLKARYAHILWCSPRKHAKYAKAAVDSYLELIDVYERKDKDAPAEHFGLDVMRIMQNAYFLGYQIKYRIDEIKSELKRLVLDFNFDSRSSFALRANVIKLMFKARKRFLKEDFAGFQNICWKAALSLTKANNIPAAIDMLNLGKKIDEKVGTETHNWILKRAKSYESLMNQRKKGDLAIPEFCLCALEEYKKIGNKAKIPELEKRYIELKSSVKLQEFGGEIDLTETIQKYNNFGDRLSEKSPEEIIQFLMLNKGLLPTYKDLKEQVEDQNQKYVFQRFAATSVIDNRGHQAEHFSIEEKEYHNILQQYSWSIELNKRFLIDAVFCAAIRQNKLSAENFLAFLNKYSWFGKTLCHKSPTGEKKEYNWLNLIAPALNEYFLQMHYYFTNPINQPNFVLSIDSLTLKMEGLLRDLCEICGVTTFYQTKDSKGRNIVREKDIHALLYEDKIKQLFDEDDLLLFRFLLVEKAGYNLRHRIAHALMYFQEYSVVYMHLLIIALLKLGKYDFVSEKSQIVGNKKRKVFHRGNCKYTKRLGIKNKVQFATKKTAVSNGYQPCMICKP